MSRNAGWLLRYGHCTDFHVAQYASTANTTTMHDIDTPRCDGNFETAVHAMMEALHDCLERLKVSDRGPEALLDFNWTHIYAVCIVGEGGFAGRGDESSSNTHTRGLLHGTRHDFTNEMAAFEDRNVLLEALFTGLYSHQIAHWLTYFEPRQLLVTNLDAYNRDTQTVMNRVFQFIGVDSFSASSTLSSSSSANESTPTFRMNSKRVSHDARDDSDRNHHDNRDPLSLSLQTEAKLCAFYTPFSKHLEDMLRHHLDGEKDDHGDPATRMQIEMDLRFGIFGHSDSCKHIISATGMR